MKFRSKTSSAGGVTPIAAIATGLATACAAAAMLWFFSTLGPESALSHHADPADATSHSTELGANGSTPTTLQLSQQAHGSTSADAIDTTNPDADSGADDAAPTDLASPLGGLAGLLDHDTNTNTQDPADQSANADPSQNIEPAPGSGGLTANSDTDGGTAGQGSTTVGNSSSGGGGGGGSPSLGGSSGGGGGGGASPGPTPTPETSSSPVLNALARGLSNPIIDHDLSDIEAQLADANNDPDKTIADPNLVARVDQDLINTLKAGGAVHLAAGEHVITAIDITLPITLTADEGASLVLAVSSSDRYGLRLLGEDSSIDGLTINRGPGRAAITVDADDVTVERCTITGDAGTTGEPHGVGIYLTQASRRARILECSISNGGTGILGSRFLEDTVIASNTIEDIQGQHGIFVGQANGMLIEGNTVKRTHFVGIKAQIDKQADVDATNVLITGNTLRDTGSNAIQATRSPEAKQGVYRGLVIRSNTVFDAGGHGLYVVYADGMEVNNNTYDTDARAEVFAFVDNTTGIGSAHDTRDAVLHAWEAVDASLAPAALNSIFLKGQDDPDYIVQLAAERWANLPEGQRCIIIAPWAIYQDPPVAAPIATIIQYGMDFGGQRVWWQGIVDALKQAGLAPDRVALDWESTISYWHLVRLGTDRGPELTAALSDTSLHRYLPAEVLALDPTKFGMEDYKTSRDNVIEWNQYAEVRRNQALQHVYAEPLLLAFPDARITNYRDMLYTGEVVDNTWPYQQVAMTDESSPVLYKESVQENLDQLQAIIRRGGPTPVPWVPFPSYNGRDVWEQTVRGAYAMGVREFLYWNPTEEGKLRGDDAFAAGVIRSLNTR